MSVATKISMLLGDYASRLVRSVILVLGSPRAGTTWLAKIIDSHPNILYRHEPDELRVPPWTLHASSLSGSPSGVFRSLALVPFSANLGALFQLAGHAWCWLPD
jgi:hypothetical protein